jgi:hypothetical protein
MRCVWLLLLLLLACSGLSIPTPSGTSPVPDTIGTQVYSTEITTEVRRQQQQQQQQTCQPCIGSSVARAIFGCVLYYKLIVWRTQHKLPLVLQWRS